MLPYNKQYDLANGIFLTFDQQLDYRLLHSRHGAGVRDKMKMSFPYHKYEAVTKETFLLSCVYIMFTKAPSSYRGLVNELRDLDLKEISKFKASIINYNDYIQKDIKYIIKEYGGNVNYQNLIRDFIDKKIQFYTLWFYLVFAPDVDIEILKESRVFSHVYRNLKFIMQFLTFKQESVDNLSKVFNQIKL